MSIWDRARRKRVQEELEAKIRRENEERAAALASLQREQRMKDEAKQKWEKHPFTQLVLKEITTLVSQLCEQAKTIPLKGNPIPSDYITIEMPILTALVGSSFCGGIDIHHSYYRTYGGEYKSIHFSDLGYSHMTPQQACAFSFVLGTILESIYAPKGLKVGYYSPSYLERVALYEDRRKGISISIDIGPCHPAVPPVQLKEF